jgi:predicted 3-demethylubiquinone-9 3-methyltransferase (glyoxalase superfamily)
MVTTVTPYLMFQGDAQAAMDFYTSLFPASEIEHVQRYAAGEAGPEGSVMRATMRIAGQTLMCIDSPVRHNFTFTPAFSLFVECESESEFERLSSALAEEGMVLMAPDNYGFSRRFAWTNDRFGVSWQINLP